jgi:thiamine biosynthesis lipoprotein
VRLTIALFIAICCIAASGQPSARKFLLTGQAQGTTYQIIYYAEDSLVTTRQIDSILDELDSALSLYKPYSLINKFNQSSGGISGDEHLLKVVNKSLATFQQTNGIFDITVQPLVAAWGFGVNKPGKLPDSGMIRSIKECIGSGLLHVSGDKVLKSKPCLKIDLMVLHRDTV